MAYAKSMYFVKDGHTLGYVHPSRLNQFEVLHGSVLLGGHDWKNGPVPLAKSDVLVPATQADFDRFRVCSKGHLEQAHA